jgi:hypothetical protein
LNKSWYSHYQRVHLCRQHVTGAPSGGGYTKIYSTEGAFAALKTNGSITAWGSSDAGGTKGAPVPPASELPHAVIEPLVLRAAKAPSVE